MGYYITKKNRIYFVWDNNRTLIGQTSDRGMITKIVSMHRNKHYKHDHKQERKTISCFQEICSQYKRACLEQCSLFKDI